MWELGFLIIFIIMLYFGWYILEFEVLLVFLWNWVIERVRRGGKLFVLKDCKLWNGGI